MKMTEESLKMYFNTRALKLGDMFEIMDLLCSNFRSENGYNIDNQELANQFKNLNDLIPYISFSYYDFAEKMLSRVTEITENIKSKLKELMKLYDVSSDDEISFAKVPLKKYTCAEAETNKDFKPAIIDFERFYDLDVYEKYNVISYDFINKMQHKIWEGIVYAYIEVGASSYNNKKEIKLEAVQRYDENLINSIKFEPSQDRGFLEFLKANIINWALLNNLIEDEREVNVIWDSESNQILISLWISF